MGVSIGFTPEFTLRANSGTPTMPSMRLCRTVFIVLCAVACAGRADVAPKSAFDPARHMRVSEVREGMTGYGLSVFKGTKIDRFDVKVVSILKNFNPKYDVILIDCKGANLEHTGAIAGMSGSPIYLKDDQGKERMIGAFAYGWPMMKDPLAGVQPIEYMLGIQQSKTSVEAPAEHARKPLRSSPDVPKKLHWSLDDCRI